MRIGEEKRRKKDKEAEKHSGHTPKRYHRCPSATPSPHGHLTHHTYLRPSISPVPPPRHSAVPPSICHANSPQNKYSPLRRSPPAPPTWKPRQTTGNLIKGSSNISTPSVALLNLLKKHNAIPEMKPANLHVLIHTLIKKKDIY